MLRTEVLLDELESGKEFVALFAAKLALFFMLDRAPTRSMQFPITAPSVREGTKRREGTYSS